MKKIKALLISCIYPFFYNAVQLAVSFLWMMVMIFGMLFNGFKGSVGGNPKDFAFNFNPDSLNDIMTSPSLMWVILISAVLTLIPCILFARVRKQGLFTQLKQLNGFNFTGAIVIIITAVGLNIFFTVAYQMLLTVFPKLDSYVGGISSELVMSNFILSLITVGIIVPIIEELVFRVFLFGELKRAFSIGAAMVLQGIIFGIAHFAPFQVIYAAIFGILLGLIIVKTHSIVISILGHVFFNCTSVLLPMFVTDINPTLIILALVGGIIGILGFCYFIFYKPRNKDVFFIVENE